jgi:acyl-[acyl-carrier-protein]-phospholipid O-acyltransferase / long-chain-fatty-acid--[acyl-carrier-protein] ligase
VSSSETEDAPPAPPAAAGLWLTLLRGFILLVTSTLYRVRVLGRANVPATGSVLLAPNHVSFVDALLLLSTVGRPIRFVIEASYAERWYLRPFVRALGCVPISASGGPRQMLRAFRDAGAALERGEVVCIFPEGQLTRTGMLLPFQRGMTRLVKGRDAVIVPVYMDRVWGSVFSREGGRFLFKWPKRIPYRVTVAFGKPLPADTPADEVRNAVQDVSVDAWTARRPTRPPLHRTARRMLRRRLFRTVLADASRPRVTGLQALAGTVALARALRPEWEEQERVGILLPPSVGGVLVNLAAVFSGRTPVNLNYTVGPAGLASSARQAGLRNVVTSREFLEKAKIELPAGLEPVFVDQVRARIGRGARLFGALVALFGSARAMERACGATRRLTSGDVATIIFSSGSTGEPKGVVLSHFNVDSNVEASMQAFRLTPHDRILCVLPLFHSFGNFLLWFSVNQGIPLVLHVSPLDAENVGALVERHRVTMLLATPTFLQLYLRRCTPGQFGSLRFVVVGAAKLPASLRDAFDEAFGVEPLEGYGTTECAPVVCSAVPDFRAPGFFQPGSRRGSVGQPIPGVALRVVDPETLAPLPAGKPGMLLVRGPNVMQGYLGRDDLTAKALRDGWYVTGDVARIDDDGFVWITDRLARFSKIGGEMVPHGRVEEALHHAAGVAVVAGQQVFAVTSVPDEKKGERLAVVHTFDPARLDDVVRQLAASGLSNLFLPRRQDFVRVDALPLLGSGKLDLLALRRIATEELARRASGSEE